MKKIKNVEIRKFNIDKKENIELFESMCNKYKVPENLRLITPAVFISDTFFIKIVRDKDIYKIIEKNKKFTKPWENLEPTGARNIVDRFKKFSVIGIIGAGLIDGINPCAFATIIFFISYLAFYEYKRKELIFVGLFFTLAVFISYLLIGLGLIRVIYSIKGLPIISKIIYLGIGVMAVVLGTLSLYDYFLCKKGKAKEMKLQLPQRIKKLTQFIIRKEMEERHQSILKLSIISFITGAIISILEAICTGQIYLPTITYIIKIPEFRMRAFSYIFLYNIFFVMPLIIIFIISYIGTSVKKLSIFLNQNVAGIKMATSCILFLLAFLLFVNVR